MTMPAITSGSQLIQGIPAVWEVDGDPAGRPLAIWLTGFGGSTQLVRPHLAALAAHGFVALSFDPYQHGERRIEPQADLLARIASNVRRHFWPIMGQSIVDTSTVIDWAIGQLRVSPRVVMGGISMGGDIAVAAAGVDHRIARVAAGIATADWLRPGSSQSPGVPDERAQAFYDRFDPITHLDHYAHRPAINFQCGADDALVPADGALRFVDRLRERYGAQAGDLAVEVHEGVGHCFTDAMWDRALDWLRAS